MGFQRKPTDAAKSVAAYSSSVRWCGRLIPVSKLTGYKTLLPTEAVGYMSLVGVQEVNDVAISHTIADCYHTAKHQNFFEYL